ncbi:MAG: YceD family protein, partial [Solirubrobacteraceae bacterium]
MPAQAHEFDLAALRLSSGEGRRLELSVPIEPVLLGGESYDVQADESASRGVPVVLDVSRMMGGGYALLLRF